MWRRVVWEIGNYVSAGPASILKMEAADYTETLITSWQLQAVTLHNALIFKVLLFCACFTSWRCIHQIKHQFSLYVSQNTDRLHYRDQQVDTF